MSVGQLRVTWYNYSAFTYYLIFSMAYARTDPELITDDAPIVVEDVGSMSSDAAPMYELSSVAEVEVTELSFYHDKSDPAGVYIHLQNGDEPSLRRVVIGVVYSVAKHAGVYDGHPYSARLKSALPVTRKKDKLFYGLVSFGGGSVVLDNSPLPGQRVGPYDTLAENVYLYGGTCRQLFGFDDQEYGQFVKGFTMAMSDVRVDEEELTVTLADTRTLLSAPVPDRVFTVDAYPDLDPDDEGKYIPVRYGALHNVKATCLNDEESGAPSYTFNMGDVTYHKMHALSAVRVDKVLVTPMSVDLASGTFVLSSVDYSPGASVTLDMEGCEDDVGNLIANALDQVVDLLRIYQSIPYNAYAYNTKEWEEARAGAPDTCYSAEDEGEVGDVVNVLCKAARVCMMPQRDGRYTARRFEATRDVTQTFEYLDMEKTPALTYDPEQVLSRVRVGYNKDWANNKYTYELYDDLEQEVFNAYGVKRPKTFDTVLVSKADAIAFAADVMFLSSMVECTTDLLFKMQPLEREVMDFINAEITRRDGQGLLGDSLCEVLEVKEDGDAGEVTLSVLVLGRYVS